MRYEELPIFDCRSSIERHRPLRGGSSEPASAPIKNRKYKIGTPDLATLSKVPIQNGFTLVEIMIVIVIIGLLAGMATINVQSSMNRAKQNIARGEISSFDNALGQFYGVYGRYPTNDEGLAMLGRASEKLPEPILKSIPVDPWGIAYGYNCPGESGPYDVICYGADGKPGGEGINADIRSDKIRQ
jgi:general secretion pathway protein G